MLAPAADDRPNLAGRRLRSARTGLRDVRLTLVHQALLLRGEPEPDAPSAASRTGHGPRSYPRIGLIAARPPTTLKASGPTTINRARSRKPLRCQTGVRGVASQVAAPTQVATAPAAFECRVRQVLELGDAGRPSNNLVVAWIVRIHVADEAMDGITPYPDVLDLGGDEWFTTRDRFTLRRPDSNDPGVESGLRPMACVVRHGFEDPTRVIGRAHVAAADDRGDALPCESLGMFEECGDAKGG
jgi:hypothetical protein